MLITNNQIRNTLLSINHLNPYTCPISTDPKSLEWLSDTVNALGFVQIDPISVVEKAHYHILFARNRHFQRTWLTQSLEEDRSLFENWTHDAAILPVETWPYWQHYFERFKNYEIHKGYKNYFAPLSPKDIDYVLKFIDEEGPSRPSEIPSEVIHWNDAYFTKTSLAKMAAEYLWRTGILCVSGRRSLAKIYDLSERVIPAPYLNHKVSHEEYVDWACRKALTQLGFARPTHIARFMDAVSKEQALDWCQSHQNEVHEVSLEYADGSAGHTYFAHENTLNKLDVYPDPPKKLQLISPFDPLARDRDRLGKVFGFNYTIEIWVPKAKRLYGYYVLPILEGNRFVGRIDLKAERKKGVMNVLGLWWENKVGTSKARTIKLESELSRLTNFTGLEKWQE